MVTDGGEVAVGMGEGLNMKGAGGRAGSKATLT